jgi:hypothetical protein
MTALSNQPIDRYLAWIRLTGPLPSTAEMLAAIQWAHLHAISFESLDICPLDVPICLHVPDIYEKIVEYRRGGISYEQNSLLGATSSGSRSRSTGAGGRGLRVQTRRQPDVARGRCAPRWPFQP